MYDSVFKRVEQKYVPEVDKYQCLIKKLSKYLEKDRFFESKIGNIYFDNDNNDLIINSLEKPIFKEKVRLRCYGIPSLDDDVFLEIKRKYKKDVGKRRVKLKFKDYLNYLRTGNFDCGNQIMREIDYCFKYYNLKPVIFVGYDRLSYKAKCDEYLRVTFDFNLRSRDYDLSLDDGDDGVKYFQNGEVIMEIKTLGALPLWFSCILTELQIYPRSFSKYGSIYQKKGVDNYVR